MDDSLIFYIRILKDCIDKLSEISKISEEQFLKDEILKAASERHLQKIYRSFYWLHRNNL